jgi:peptidoglycan/LPS O-acetylase OafA/YrhL
MPYTPHKTPTSESPNLDFLRAIAVLSVYAFHFFYTLGISHIPTPGIRPDWGWFLGRFGVLIFFVHTSLVLMMSLERSDQSGRSLFGAFYVRRFFRIYPLSVACIAIIVFFHLPQSPLVEYIRPDLSTILANFFLCTSLFYKPNILSVLWSLPLEVQMYVLLPFIYLIGKKYRMRGIIVLWLGAIIAAYVQPHVAERMIVAGYAPCFMAGIASYFIGFGSVRRRLPFWGWPVTIAAAAGIYMAFGSGNRSEVAWFICLMIGLSAPLYADLGSRHLRKITGWIARYSYGIYLTHMYALWTAFILLKDQPLLIRCIVLVALSVGLPWLFFEFLESPMIKLGARLANRLPAVSRAPSGMPESVLLPKGTEAVEPSKLTASVAE